MRVLGTSGYKGLVIVIDEAETILRTHATRCRCMLRPPQRQMRHELRVSYALRSVLQYHQLVGSRHRPQHDVPALDDSRHT